MHFRLGIVTEAQELWGAWGACERSSLCLAAHAVTHARGSHVLILHGLGELDDPEVLHKAYADAGFDADTIMADMGGDAIKAKLLENTNAAVERGAFGIPTFFVGDEIFFGKERLEQVEELL